ncbi:MAG: hypothetical protein MZW92_44080 [Comamonadaceae bacterium]|nr:hypothetical protein [Comamonadaceae bacterium]
MPQRLKSESPETAVTDKWSDITGDSDIDIVVEVIGGISPAKEIIIDALHKGRRMLLPPTRSFLLRTGQSILEAIVETGNSIGFEAAVGGAYHAYFMKKGMAGNHIKSIVGILKRHHAIISLHEWKMTGYHSVKR